MGSEAPTHRLRTITLRLEFAYEFPSEIVALRLHYSKHACVTTFNWHLDS